MKDKEQKEVKNNRSPTWFGPTFFQSNSQTLLTGGTMQNAKLVLLIAVLGLVSLLTQVTVLATSEEPACNQPRDLRTWTNPHFPFDGTDEPGCTALACPEEVTFDSAETVDLCPTEGCCDSISTSGIPAVWNLNGIVDIQYAFTGACDDMGNELFPPFNRVSIEMIPISQNGDLNLDFCYPKVGDWLSFEIHVDVAIQVTDENGASVGWVGGDQIFAPGTIGPGGQDWDLFCFLTGCTPGFWKNHVEAWPDTIPGTCDGFTLTCSAGDVGAACTADSDCDVSLSPSDEYCEVFGIATDPPCDLTLLDAVDAKGNNDGQALLRHSVAALLNSINSDGATCGFGYGYGSATAIIDAVAAAWESGDPDVWEALKNEIVAFNETICTRAEPAPWLGGFGGTTDECFNMSCNPNF